MIVRDDVLAWIRAYAAAIAAQKDHLTRLDADIGDGDHGSNMDRGFQAVVARLPDLADKDVGAILGDGLKVVAKSEIPIRNKLRGA